MHEERTNKHANDEPAAPGAVPAYLLDREGVSRAKVREDDDHDDQDDHDDGGGGNDDYDGHDDDHDDHDDNDDHDGDSSGVAAADDPVAEVC
jgi:ABC-type Zn2+ transport system substrate-binding protein/surface adhesin